MPADSRPSLLLASPHSRRGRDGLRAARDVLARHGIDVEVPAWAPDRLHTVIADHADRVRAVIVAGGDGTLNAAASGLLAGAMADKCRHSASNLAIGPRAPQVTHPPQVREQTRQYPPYPRTPNPAAVPFNGRRRRAMS